MLNTVDIQKQNYSSKGYAQNPIRRDSSVVEGYFYKESTVKDMAIRRVNKSLCWLLILAVIVTFVSYYFVIYNHMKLNSLRTQIQNINSENAELQNNLDRLKSLNNVDNKMIQYNLLKKAENVVEVPIIHVASNVETKHISSAPFKWAIGY